MQLMMDIPHLVYENLVKKKAKYIKVIFGDMEKRVNNHSLLFLYWNKRKKVNEWQEC